ncbi:unnamed protein product [Allacma fusca]|uniref:Uncharacterized protein n=1 Tax=Allacma fusca TaxID=39272 RepID=A0A8J2NMS1_9HEXA|nr:unnamed protein product [Allacma fusca]
MITTIWAIPTSPAFEEENAELPLHNSEANPVEGNSAGSRGWIPKFWSDFSKKFRVQVNLSHFAANHKFNTVYIDPLCFFNCNSYNNTNNTNISNATF